MIQLSLPLKDCRNSFDSLLDCVDLRPRLTEPGLNYESCLCYFNDIIIPSIDINQHCERLELVLERLQKANLRVKASKCLFGADSCKIGNKFSVMPSQSKKGSHLFHIILFI